MSCVPYAVPVTIEEDVVAGARHGEVRLDAAAAVERLGVGDVADLRARRGCRRPSRGSPPRPARSPRSWRTTTRRTSRPSSGWPACSAPVAADQYAPGPAVRAQPASSPARGVGLVVVDALPARLLAELARRARDATRTPGWSRSGRPACALQPGIGDVVVALVALDRAGQCVARRAPLPPEPVDVHVPDVEARARRPRSTRPSPCRCRRHRRCRARRNRPRRRTRRPSVSPRQNSLSGVKASGPLMIRAYPDLGHRRHPALGVRRDLLEPRPVLGQQPSVEVRRDRVERALRSRCKAPGRARSRPSPGRRPPAGSRRAGRDRAGSAAACRDAAGTPR